MSKTLARDPFLVALGARIQEVRVFAGWTQGDLAQRSAYGRPRISMIETGRANISIQGLVRIAAALDVPLAILLPDEEGDDE